MGFIEDLKATFSKHNVPFSSDEGEPGPSTSPSSGANETTTSTQTTTTTQPAPSPSPAPAPAPQPDPQIAAMSAEIEQLKEAGRTERATAYVDSLIMAGKVLPAERGQYLTEFSQALRDDARNPELVTFSDGKGGEVKLTREALKRSIYDNLPSRVQFGEHIAAFALPLQAGASEQETPQEQARKEALAWVEANYRGNGTGK